MHFNHTLHAELLALQLSYVFCFIWEITALEIALTIWCRIYFSNRFWQPFRQCSIRRGQVPVMWKEIQQNTPDVKIAREN